MSTVREYVDVEVPVQAAYAQWAGFERLPGFMGGVREVVRFDERHLQWRTAVAGVERTFNTEVVEQVPNERIRWRTSSGDLPQDGTVTFEPLGPDRTRVAVAIDYRPTAVADRVADRLGTVSRQVLGDLRRFKVHTEDLAAPARPMPGPDRR